ncbi:MAG: M28 family peptidase, partial [Chitinophagales bacterium]
MNIFIACLVLFFACASDKENNQKSSAQKSDKAAQPKVDVPKFSADSAYYFVEKQVGFGPRVPNTPEHTACGDWLINKMENWADNVHVQKAELKAFNGEILKARNIIAEFNPQAKKRIMLSAHWDTRPFADQDPNAAAREKPIDGANDGASGVGVLMEIARQLSQQMPEIGIDIIFWDAEDYGQPDADMKNPRMSDSYCLGSQFWAKNKHRSNYSAKYGILLDMVGAEDATFRLEGHSMQFAPTLNRKIWNKGIELGFGRYFILEETRPIIDDHFYITRIAKIPTIDIIDLKPHKRIQFGDFWHTHDDNMEIISPETLKAVGQTLLEVIYLE